MSSYDKRLNVTVGEADAVGVGDYRAAQGGESRAQ